MPHSTVPRAALLSLPAGVAASAGAARASGAPRKRAQPGQRREQILQALAQMLEQPATERITTAALAARLAVSEAALYRHFASKAQMFEALIESIEQRVLAQVGDISGGDLGAAHKARRIVGAVLLFGERHPGLARVMVGDALVFEHDRLLARMNQLFDRLEAQLRCCLHAAGDGADVAASAAAVDAQALASGLTALMIGALQRYTRSGFRRRPTEALDRLLALVAR